MRLLKGSLWAFLWLASATAFFLLVLLARPSWFVNSRTAAAALHRFGGAYAPRWKSLSVDVASPGLLTKRLRVSAEEFCFAAPGDSLRGCLPRVGLDATVSVGRRPILLVRRVDELTLHARSLRLDSRRAPARERKREGRSGFVGLPDLVPAPLRRARLGKVDVDVADFASVTGSGTTRLDLSARFQAEDGAPLRARAVASSGGKVYRAEAELDSDLLREGRLTYLQADARVRGAATADVKARIEQGRGQELRAVIDARARVSGRSAFAKLEATQTPARYAVTGFLGAADPGGPLRRAELRRCSLEAPLREGTTKPERVELSCGLRLEPKPFGAPLGVQVKALTGTVRLEAAFPRSKALLKQDAFDARLDVSVGPVADFYEFFAKLHADFSGRTGSLPESLKSEHVLEAGFKVGKFEDLVAYLKGTAYAVPAPLHVLEGPIEVSVRSGGPTRGEDHGFDYDLTSRLANGNQRLFTRVNGRLLVKKIFTPLRQLSSRTDVLLEDVALELPYLKVGAFPSVSVDKRIKTGDPSRDAAVDAKREAVKGQASAPRGDHSVRLRTVKPALLHTNLAKEPVPISLDLNSTSAGMEGRIQVEPFKLEIFKQEARVDHVTLTPHPGSKAQDLDGKIVYKKSDVTIDILLLGSTEKPQVDFQSDPPMSRDEIVAVLFYGKSPGELDSEQQATVGNASAGMANGAFGVVSLYLLAATPIDYVGYDPATQTYQARFKLPGGATLSVGSNLEESRTLTLRKRILKNVELETGVRRTPGETNAVTTFLQWFRRY